MDAKGRYSDRKILFLSGIYPEELYEKLTDTEMNKNIQIAADVLQKHLIHGMDELLWEPVKLVNAPYIGMFPNKSKIIRMKKSTFSHCYGAEDINIRFWNIPGLRHFSICHNRKKEIKRWVKNNAGETVMAYALTLRNVTSLLYAKRLDKSVATCMVVPDLPIYMRMSSGWMYKIAKKAESWLIFRNLHKIDSFVLLTEQMNDVIKSDRYCVVEGIATDSGIASQPDESVQIILYAGTLDKKYGINTLLQAFHKIERDNVRLFICGMGDSQSEIDKMIQIDQRICCLGQVSREEILKLQSRASVLVNPRPNTEFFTKYSFPSKNLEYLSSGVPLLAYKLEGIPDEYDPYIHYICGNTIEDMKEALEEILNQTVQERILLGERARRFVLENKSEIVQVKKILEITGSNEG